MLHMNQMLRRTSPTFREPGTASCRAARLSPEKQGTNPSHPVPGWLGGWYPRSLEACARSGIKQILECKTSITRPLLLPLQARNSPLTGVKRDLIFSESILASLGLLHSLQVQGGVLPSRSKWLPRFFVKRALPSRSESALPSGVRPTQGNQTAPATTFCPGLTTCLGYPSTSLTGPLSPVTLVALGSPDPQATPLRPALIPSQLHPCPACPLSYSSPILEPCMHSGVYVHHQQISYPQPSLSFLLMKHSSPLRAATLRLSEERLSPSPRPYHQQME